MVRGIDFYRYTKEAINQNVNVHFVQGTASVVTDGEDQDLASVNVDGRTFQARWILKGAFLPSDFIPKPERYHYLTQHFQGWIIHTKSPQFDPKTFTMFDFRTPQMDAMRFIYVLPFTTHDALIEYTQFTKKPQTADAYDFALQAYIRDTLNITEYKVMETEAGGIPMTNHPFARKIGHRIMTIGTPGGLVKPSTGYAFHRILKDTEQIIQSLIRYDHPFAIQSPPRQYAFFDRIMLGVMERDGSKMEHIFSQMFRNNGIKRIFNFLDETDPLIHNLPLLLSVDPLPFISAVIRG
jgi:lycopene beta-cyclase